jgi:hypothetical protein
VAASFSFTAGCDFNRDQNGVVTLTWDNGAAIAAVKGASVDYVEPHFHVACTLAANTHTYAPQKDLGRLLAGGLEPKLALVVVGIRKIVLSMDRAVLNRAEIHTVTDADPDGQIPDAAWNRIVAEVGTFKSVLDLALTILGMNGISLLNKGHHYKDDDPMWLRLNAAVGLEDMMGRLAIVNYDGILYHDALHPIDLTFKANLVAQENSALIGHINGVLLKRMPGVPAGTGLLFASIAAIEQVTVARTSLLPILQPLLTALIALRAEVRQHPMQWCTVFQVAQTPGNLARVAAMEPLCAMVYGMCRVLFTRKASIMKSVSFKNNSLKHPAHVIQGNDYVESLGDEVLSAQGLADLVAAMVSSATGTQVNPAVIAPAPAAAGDA